MEPDPNFVTINSKEPDSIAQAYKAIDEGKKVLLDEIGLNSSELTKMDKFAKSKETEIFMNMNIIQHPVLVGHYSQVEQHLREGYMMDHVEVYNSGMIKIDNE